MMRTLAIAVSVAALMATGAAQAGNPIELVVNGNFTSGADGLAGWTQAGVPIGTSVLNGIFWAGAPNDFGYLSQSLLTTAGKNYNFSFDLSGGDFGGTLYFAALMGGQILYNTSSALAPTHFDFQGTASAGSTLLQFAFQNDNDSFYLSNVSVTTQPVPEPESYAMMFAGLGVLGFMGKRRRRTS
jgi:hypothetical protein